MSSSTTEVCFNSYCKQASEKWRRGWRRRTGDYAHLCDRCASAYEGGIFCETFHLNASGWRCCESCGKQIHCGCIVSFHMFVLLDAGGIECLTCARKSYVLTPNPAWPPPLDFLPSQPERTKDLSVKTLSSIAGSGPVPWRRAPSLFNGSDIQSNVHLRMPFEMDVSGRTDRNPVCGRLSTASPEMKQGHSYERLFNEKLRLGPSETLQDGNTGLDIMEQPCHFVNEIKTVNPKIDFSSTLNSAMGSSSRIEADNGQFASIISEPAAISILVGKSCRSRGGMSSCGEPQIYSGKVRGDGRGRNQLVSRYRLQMTDEELQQISGDSKSVITPLFEKMLSAKDPGRIKRLILPKRWAEVYFPQITHPEGLPLKVQDVKGKEWVFQFRFCLNNNSRMYVLEGITSFIQSMQLQAGDVVTFCRLEPEGKLVMGCRKNSAVPSSDQRDEGTIVGRDASNLRDGSPGYKHGDVIGGHTKEKMLEDKPINHSKRKNSSFSAKSKRLRIENEDVIALKLTWKEAQGLMRPPAKIVPSVVVVEGCEFEEFEEVAPVIGRPTIPGIDHIGARTQWVQCDDCFKWRKVPSAALLPSRWICPENVWDLGRSQCSSAEELTKEQLEHMLHTTNKESSKKEETTGWDTDQFVFVEGLDALANLAIKGGKEGPPPATSGNSTKHPRHKPGCACIVCNGKGSKHDQSCERVVCNSQPGFPQLHEKTNDLDNSTLNQERVSKEGNIDEPNGGKSSNSPLKCRIHLDNGTINPEPVSKEGNIGEPNGGKSLNSPLRGRIDLNIQPDKEEELSPGSGSGGPMNFMERYLRRVVGL